MILKRRVALNNVWLDQVDSRIVITSIEPGDGKESITAVDSAARDGERVTSNRRKELDIAVRFRILERGKSVSGMQERSEVLEAVNAWAAQGGTLTVNYKQNRRLNVILAQAPGEGSLWDYTKEYQITFRAYDVPFWEDAAANSQEIGTAATGSATVNIGGSARTPVTVYMLNTGSGTINEPSITIGGKTMSFTDLGLEVGERLEIMHTAKDLVRIRIRNSGGTYRSAMAKRDITSADDFRPSPGSVAVSYSAWTTVTTTVYWRCRYL